MRSSSAAPPSSPPRSSPPPLPRDELDLDEDDVIEPDEDLIPDLDDAEEQLEDDAGVDLFGDNFENDYRRREDDFYEGQDIDDEGDYDDLIWLPDDNSMPVSTVVIASSPAKGDLKWLWMRTKMI
jgi:DNA replication licensing factor MCM2